LYGDRGMRAKGEKSESEVVEKPKSRYVPPEEWVDTKTDEEIAWEKKVKRDAQREGNPLNQEEILRKTLNQ